MERKSKTQINIEWEAFELQEKYPSEFDYRERHGPLRCGDLVSSHHIIENRETDPQEYDKIMDLAALAIATYNKEHQTKFKVVEIEKLNRQGCRVGTYLMTFSAVDIKGTEHEKRFYELHTCTELSYSLKGFMPVLVLLAWLFVSSRTWLAYAFFLGAVCLYFFCFNKLKRRSVPDLKASKIEIGDDTLTHKTFQATVCESWGDGWTRHEPVVALCRAA